MHGAMNVQVMWYQCLGAHGYGGSSAFVCGEVKSSMVE